MENESGFKLWLKNIWPSIYKIVNNIFYNLLNFFKKSARLIIDQIRYG